MTDYQWTPLNKMNTADLRYELEWLRNELIAAEDDRNSMATLAAAQHTQIRQLKRRLKAAEMR